VTTVVLELFRVTKMGGELGTQGPIKVFTNPNENIKHSYIQAYQSKLAGYW